MSYILSTISDTLRYLKSFLNNDNERNGDHQLSRNGVTRTISNNAPWGVVCLPVKFNDEHQNELLASKEFICYPAKAPSLILPPITHQQAKWERRPVSNVQVIGDIITN